MLHHLEKESRLQICPGHSKLNEPKCILCRLAMSWETFVLVLFFCKKYLTYQRFQGSFKD